MSGRGVTLSERAKRSLRVGRALRIVWAAAPRWTVLSLVLVFVRALLPLLVLYLTKLVVDALAAAVSGAPTAPDFNHVLLLIGLAGLAGLLGALARSVAGLANEAQGHLVTDHVLSVLHEKSVEVDLAYYEDPQYYDTLHRAQLEAPFRPTRIINNLIQIGQSAITAVGILALLISVHWLLAAVLAVAVIPGFGVRLRYAHRAYDLQRRRASTERRASYLGWILTSAMHAKEVRLFDLGPLVKGRFKDFREQLRRERIELSRSRSLADMAAQVGTSLAVFGSYAFIAYQTFQGVLTLGDLVMYFGAVQRGQSVLASLLNGFGGLYEDNLFLSNLDDFLDLEPGVVAPAAPKPVPSPIRSGIELHDVAFRYPGSSRPLLEDINLSMRPGQMVALIGPNGSGKTTLVKLLCRFYDPLAGAVTIDGTDIREFDPAELRRQISVIFQDYGRYQLSARDNIWFGDVHRPPDDRIEEAARTAGAHELIQNLRHGYETTLSRLFEDGEELSVGEWQKIALARVFVGDAQLIIVDEPTSALDARAEAAVFNTLRRLVRDRAVLVISHRFSTVLMADYIYVLDEGRIIESGTHDQLIDVGGMYAQLFEIQAAPYRRKSQTTPLS
jgi:ATP-binding cassette subfamily B protein